MKLEIYYDYVCPFCYMGLEYLGTLLPKYPKIIPVYRPVEVHSTNEPRAVFSEESDFWTKGILPQAEQLGLPQPKLTTPVPYTNRAIEGFYSLEAQGGDATKYNREMFQQIFTYLGDVENVETVAKTVEVAGGNFSKTLEDLEKGVYSDAVLQGNTRAYEKNGIDVVPAFVAEGKSYTAKPGWGMTLEDLEAFLKTLA